jgi:methionyl-tRNA formyltransferase
MLKIVLFGTPEFPIPAFEAVRSAGFAIKAVVTAPDKPAGRGMQLQSSAVKQWALEKDLLVLQPTKLKDPNFIEQLQALEADLFIVIAFRMLPEIVWQMPRIGTFNLHASLLPSYRGAAPIQWAIRNGEKETGVTTFFLKHEIDTGDWIMQERVAIGADMTGGELHDILQALGAKVVLKSVVAIDQKNYTTTPQSGEIKHAPKLQKQDACIQWNQSTQGAYDQYRAFIPFPGSFTILNDKILKLHLARPIYEAHTHLPGSVFSDGKTFLQIATTDGYLNLLEVQPEGKKRMPIADFLRGNTIQ